MVAVIGAHRYQGRASAPQIHAALRTHQVPISQRNVQYWLERYDELVALSVRHPPERCARLDAQGRLILAMDGLQPEVGHEVLWVIREVLSEEVLAARSLLSSSHGDLAALLREAVAGLSAPVVGVVSDGQPRIGQAVAEVFPGGAASMMSLPLSQASRRPGVGSRSACQEGTEETGAGHPATGASGGRTGGRGSADRSGLLCRGPWRLGR